MEVLVTEADRRILTWTAWEQVRRLNVPRHVRLMLRDKLVDAAVARLRAGDTSDVVAGPS